jgi:hypothetical protein
VAGWLTDLQWGWLLFALEFVMLDPSFFFFFFFSLVRLLYLASKWN